MHHVLVCKEAHGDLRRGDTVIDPAEVKRLHQEAPASFVRRPAHGHEAAAIDDLAKAKAETAKAAKKPTTEKVA